MIRLPSDPPMELTTASGQACWIQLVGLARPSVAQECYVLHISLASVELAELQARKAAISLTSPVADQLAREIWQAEGLILAAISMLLREIEAGKRR